MTIASPRAAAITVLPPADFRELTQQQQVEVDVYFGGKFVGDAVAVTGPGSLTFSDPAKIARLIPNTAQPDEIARALAQPNMPTNSQLICRQGLDPLACGRLKPETVGIIFDSSRFRVDLFVNPRWLAVLSAQEDHYLPPPEPGLTIVNAIGAVLAGTNDGQQYHNIRDRLIFGAGDQRLRAEWSHASGFGVQADQLDIEIDRHDLRYRAGLFFIPGTDIDGRKKAVGLGIESQTDTRLDKDSLQGDPLVVFLARRSRVDILRDGRIVGTRVYDPGNQTLDTSGMPDGAYEVVLRIEEIGGARRDERRFYSKNPFIPSIGRKIFFAYGGAIVDDRRRGLLNLTRQYFLQVGGALRLSRGLALDAKALAVNQSAMLEAGLNLITRPAQVRLGVMAGTNGTIGELVRIGSSGYSRINFNLEARHIAIAKPLFSIQTQPELLPPGVLPGQTQPPIVPQSLGQTSYSQVSGVISYSLPRGQLLLAGSYSRIKGQAASYSIGPNLRIEILRYANAHLYGTATYALTSSGRSGFAGLSFQVFGKQVSLAASTTALTTSVQGESAKVQPLGSIHGDWHTESATHGDIRIGAGYEHASDRDLISADGEYRNRLATIRGDVVDNIMKGRDQIQYAVGFDTTIALKNGVLAFDGRNAADSVVMVHLAKSEIRHKFQVMINDAPVGTLHSGGNLALALNAYRRYNVRVRQLDDARTQFDASSHAVSLYPGNVVRLAWQVRAVAAMFGQIVNYDGQPIANARIHSLESVGETDDNGFFEIETYARTTLKVEQPGGRSCKIVLPKFDVGVPLVKLGKLYCQDEMIVSK